MGLAVLVLGLAVFIANHIFVTFRGARAAAIARLGKPVYFSVFGLVSLIGLALIVWGYVSYRATGWVQIWYPPVWMRHVTVGLMLFSVILATAYIMPSHIKARAKHPLLAAVKIWAFAHLLVNGDLGSMIMFGSFLAWAVYARISAKRRTDQALPVAPKGWTNDIVVVVLGIVVYLLLGFYFHPYVIGVPVFAAG